MKTRELTRPIRRTKFAAAVGALALFSVIAASAQDAVTGPPAQSTSAASPSPAPSASPSPSAQADTIGRIIVTANKREENIQEVPSSVSVIDDVQLDNLHATQLTDYAPYIPGLQVNSGGTPGQDTIALRGLAPISSGSTVGTYINEVPTGSSGIFQRATSLELDLLPYDIRRVEVLRGPQGTLYGANSIGGLIKFVTIDPALDTPEFHLGGGIYGVAGSDDPGGDVHASANIPLASNHLGLRVSYARNELPGFIDNVVNGEKDINSATQQSALVALLWQPNDIFSLKLTALGQRIESDNNATVALDPRTRQPLFGDLTNQRFVDEPFTKTIGLLALTLEVDLGWADFISASGYSNTKTDQRTDATMPFGQAPLLLGLPVTGISGLDLGLDLDKFSQELRLTSKPGGRFLWQLGAFYTYERAANSQFVFLRQLDGTPFTGPLAILNTLAAAAIPSTYMEYAGFANASYDFTDRLSLAAGLRFSRNDQDFSQIVSNGILLPLGTTPGSSGENVLDFMVSPQFKLDKDKLLYVRIASGYQPGGPNVALPGVPPQVGATTAVSYEGGLKSEFLDSRLLFNIAGYHIDLSDIQVGTIVNNATALVNGGKATSNGLELTAEYQPITGLRFGVNGAYTNATLSNDAPSLSGLSGDRLPFIPEFSGSLTADYFFPLWGAHGETAAVVSGKDAKAIVPAATRGGGWTGHLGAGVRYVGESFSAVESSPTAYRQDSFAALDLNADISNNNWTIRVFAKNVTDERVYQTIAPVTDIFGNVDHLQGVPIQPRTVGVEVDFKF